MHAVFELIDVNCDGTVSKLELINAMNQKPDVEKFIVPDHIPVMDREWSFDAIDAIFEAMAQGNKRISYADFSRYFCKLHATTKPPLRRWPTSLALLERSQKRVFIIGPGFGRMINPQQTRMVEE